MAKKEHWLSVRRVNVESIFFCLFLLFLPTQLGKHFWPSWSYILGIRSDYLSPTVYLTDILLAAVLFCSLCRVLSKRKDNTKFPAEQDLALQDKVQNLNRLLLFYAISYILLAVFLWPGSKPLEIYGLVKLGEMLLLFFYIKTTLFSRYSLKMLGLLLGIGLIIECFLAFAQFITQGSLDGWWYWLGERHYTSQTITIATMFLDDKMLVRPYATFSHPNILGGYALCLTILFYYLGKMDVAQRALFRTRYAFFTLFIISILTIFVSFSRLSILTLLGSFIVIYFLEKKKLHLSKVFSLRYGKNHLSSKALFTILLIIFFLAVGILLNIPQRFVSFQLTDESLVQRELLLQASTQLFLHHPLFGVGLNNFLPSLSHQPEFSLNFYLLQPVHNIFILLLVETGLCGAILFAWSCIYTIRRLLARRANVRQQKIVNMCLTLLFALSLSGNGDHYWLTSQQGLLIASTFFGVSWAVITIKKIDI